MKVDEHKKELDSQFCLLLFSFFYLFYFYNQAFLNLENPFLKQEKSIVVFDGLKDFKSIFYDSFEALFFFSVNDPGFSFIFFMIFAFLIVKIRHCFTCKNDLYSFNITMSTAIAFSIYYVNNGKAIVFNAFFVIFILLFAMRFLLGRNKKNTLKMFSMIAIISISLVSIYQYESLKILCSFCVISHIFNCLIVIGQLNSRIEMSNSLNKSP